MSWVSPSLWKPIQWGHIEKVYKSISSCFIKCSTYVHFRDEPLTRLCRLPPWLTGGNSERLGMDKDGVAVGKVCSPLWYSTFWFITMSTYFLKKIPHANCRKIFPWSWQWKIKIHVFLCAHLYAFHIRFSEYERNRKATCKQELKQSVFLVQHLTCQLNLWWAGVPSASLTGQSSRGKGLRHRACWRQRLGMASTWNTHHLTQYLCLPGTHVLLCPEWRMMWKIRKGVKGYKCKKILFLLYFGGGWWGQKNLSILDVSRWFMHVLKHNFISRAAEEASTSGEGGKEQKERVQWDSFFIFIFI